MWECFFQLCLVPFKEKLGFLTSVMRREFTLSIPSLHQRPVRVANGCLVMCIAEAVATGRNVKRRPDAILLHRPDKSHDLRWNVTRLFCGAYCGWSQACERLNSSTVDLRVSRETFVDKSQDVMREWSRGTIPTFVTSHANQTKTS